MRNAGVHAAVIDRRTAMHWRDRFVEVGCRGDLVELAKVPVRQEGVAHFFRPTRGFLLR